MMLSVQCKVHLILKRCVISLPFFHRQLLWLVNGLKRPIANLWEIFLNRLLGKNSKMERWFSSTNRFVPNHFPFGVNKEGISGF